MPYPEARDQAIQRSISVPPRLAFAPFLFFSGYISLGYGDGSVTISAAG